jgi:anti-anti-sigma regulatory factor
VTFSASKHRLDGDTVIRLEVVGHLGDPAVERLSLVLLEAIIIDRPDELLVDLGAVESLSATAVTALFCGCITAIDYGTEFRVVNVPRQDCNTRQATAMLDVLTRWRRPWIPTSSPASHPACLLTEPSQRRSAMSKGVPRVTQVGPAAGVGWSC